MSLQDLDKDKDKENENDESKDSIEKQILSLQLGDVIRILDQTNDVLNEKVFMIDYIDTEKIRLIDNDDLSVVKLNIN